MTWEMLTTSSVGQKAGWASAMAITMKIVNEDVLVLGQNDAGT